MGSLFRRIFDLIDGDDDEEVRGDIAYNYTFFPPLAMAEKVPGLGFTFEWAFLVLVQALRILLNALAVKLDQKSPELADALDRIVDDIRDRDYLKAAAAIVSFVSDLKKLDRDTGDALEGSAANIVKLVAPGDSSRAKRAMIDFMEDINEAASKAVDGLGDGLEMYEDLFQTLPLPAISQTFTEDAVFADMRVAGPNPLVIELMTEPLPHFPVTDDHYRAAMGDGDSLAAALAERRLFVADYAAFNGALAGSYPKQQKFLYAPIALFALPRDGGDQRRLTPVAIQTGQQPGPDNPIFTPPPPDASDQAKENWMAVKTVVQIADANVHEAVSHLARTHLFIEPFVLATHNQLADHAVGKLLTPHFEGTLFINNLAQSTLVAPEGFVDQLMGGTIDQSRVYAMLGAQSWQKTFNQVFLREELSARGVLEKGTLPYYPYRDNALLIWDAIHQWVASYLQVYYPREGDPENDDALQQWLAELTNHEGGRLDDIGEDGRIRTRAYLGRALTMVIFTSSAQHAAVNFPQSAIMSYTPAMPLGGYAAAPTKIDQPPPAEWTEMLSPKKQALSQLNVLWLLGSVYYTRLGDYGDDYFDDSRVKDALAAFQKRLQEIEAEIKASDPNGDYPFLLPSRIPQSINI